MADKVGSHFDKVAKLLDKPIGFFGNTQQGFSNYTDTALEIATNPQSMSRALNQGRQAYFCLVNAKDGILVIIQDGKLQTMYAATFKYFNTLK